MFSYTEFPFVGRNQEIEQVLAFHRATISTDNLGVLWIEGEAGIGKTYLLKKIAQHISHNGSVLCHIRLYPDTPSTINELLDHYLDTTSHLQELLQQQRHSSTAAKIRHLARLKPTTLILEDLHQLSDSAVHGLFTLFQALAEEPVCIICASRPGEYAASLRLLPYIGSTITLPPLKSDEISILLQSYQALPSTAPLVETLLTATKGNPLVLRSVIAAIPNDNMQSSIAGIEPIITQLIQHSAKVSVQSLTAGLTSSLSPEEHQHACKLARLGEVFSEEAAQLVTNSSVNILEVLSQKGIITQVREAILPTIGVHSSKLPWRFVHSLLRDELSAHGPIPAEQLLCVLDRNAPLYSTTLLHSLISEPMNDSDLLLRIHQHVIALFKKHELNYHFSLLQEISAIAIQLIETNLVLLSTRQEINAEVDLASFIHFRASLQRTEPDRIKETVNTYLEKTINPRRLADAEHRLIAMASVLFEQPKISGIDTPLTPLSCLQELQKLLTDFPELHHSVDFVRFLTSIAATTRTTLDSEVIQLLRHHVDAIVDSQNEEETFSTEHMHTLIAMVLTLFITEEDVEYCINLANRTLSQYALYDVPEQFSLCYISLLVNSGQLHKAKEVLNYLHSSPAIQSGHSAYTRFLCTVESTTIDSSFGAPRSYVEYQLNKAVRWVREADPEFAESYCENLFLESILLASYLQNDLSWMETAFQQYADNPRLQNQLPWIQAQKALVLGDLEELRSTAGLSKSHARFHELIVAGTAQEVDLELIYRLTCQFFERDSFNRSFILAVAYITTILESIFTRLGQAMSDEMQELITDALRRALQWSKNGDLVGFMRLFLLKSKNYFSQDEYENWHAALVSAEKNVAAKYNWEVPPNDHTNNARLQIAMLGQITYTVPNEQPKRIQGAKARAILGLMVANELSRQRLSYKGFREVIFGSLPENNATTDNIRAAIARLRSLLGKDSIITDGKSAPSLNLERVEIDLIRISRTLDKCKEAIRSRYPRKARQYIMEALHSDTHSPAYPTLYNEFFESARLDFELDLRNSILTVSDFLQKEGDVEGAIATLEEGLERIPNDDELLLRLSDILAASGRHTEAISIRNSWT